MAPCTCGSSRFVHAALVYYSRFQVRAGEFRRRQTDCSLNLHCPLEVTQDGLD